jgi:hypothetical protein
MESFYAISPMIPLTSIRSYTQFHFSAAFSMQESFSSVTIESSRNYMYGWKVQELSRFKSTFF